MNSASPTPDEILATRAQRHYLTTSRRGGSDSDYLAILGRLGPMRPPSYEFPGTPVVLFDRHEDSAGATPYQVGERVRRARKVFKGRFQDGRVAYVPSTDVPLYIAAYRRSRELTPEEQSVLCALDREGPLHKTDIAEVSGVKGRELSSALQKLQQVFLVYEEQLETEWNNAWFHLGREQSSWLASLPTTADARIEVLRRFTDAYVATSVREARDWSGFPAREVRDYLGALVTSGHLASTEVDGMGQRFLVSNWEPVRAEGCVAILDPGDPLVTAQKCSLKRRYDGVPVLKYILVDGRIVGVATGKWGIRPFDVDDVLVEERALDISVREQVIAKLRRHFPPARQRILAYGGVVLDS